MITNMVQADLLVGLQVNFWIHSWKYCATLISLCYSYIIIITLIQDQHCNDFVWAWAETLAKKLANAIKLISEQRESPKCVIQQTELDNIQGYN